MNSIVFNIVMMGRLIAILSLSIFCCVSFAKERVFVLTDLSNEPDDEESMVRFLAYSNEYDVEGLVATTSTHLREKPREDLLRRQLNAYGKVRGNLVKHAPGYPTQQALESVTATGQPHYGMAAVGKGKSTAGSRLLLEAADRDDDRPLWISVWGGANTLAQALFDARETRPPEEMEKLIAKLKVYTISDQDDAGRWLRLEFPELFYIVSPSAPDHWADYYNATWTGIAGDLHYKYEKGLHIDMVLNPWLEENVMKNHGALGDLYPPVAYIMEGDTPSFFGLINNGLGWAESPAYGGWAGRYTLYKSYAETRPIWTNNFYTQDTVEVNGKPVTSDQATIWRWRKHYQNDFAARMDWCVAEDYGDANHNPIAVLNGDQGRDIVKLDVNSGESVTLSAKGSSDPDGNGITHSWFIYKEAGDFAAEAALSAKAGEEVTLKLPLVGSGDIHIILTVEDSGSPNLVSYRRAIVNVVDPAIDPDQPLSIETPIGVLLENPAADAVLEKYLPAAIVQLRNSKEVRPLSLDKLSGHLPGLSDSVLMKIDKALKAL